MQFYHRRILTNLGPCAISNGEPTRWKSFMTDDSTPLEFSWNWGSASKPPDKRVRFSLEAIGPAAGSAVDPWNMKASLKLLRQLELELPSLDLQWFHSLKGKMLPSDSAESPNSAKSSSRQSDLSSIFLAFEFGDDRPSVKAYMLPNAKALILHSSAQQVLLDAAGAFAQEKGWNTLQEVIEDLRYGAANEFLDPFILSFDCERPEYSRLKIYFRCQDTSFASVRKVMSMYDDPTAISTGIQQLQTLWQLLFCCNEALDESQQLSPVEHDTAGMLYYVEVRPSSSRKTVKVYLPVKHYGKNDLHTARSLAEFIKARNASQSRFADSYLCALSESFGPQELEASRGSQTYISCVVQSNSLSVTSYINPRIYSRF